jgi:O-antigen/teichoic acid export membrane protein
MFVDKAFLLVGSFVVTVLVARYLGPENLGLISYGVALGALAIAISGWGADYTIYDTAAKNPRRSVRYIASTGRFRLAIYMVVYVLITAWLLLSGDHQSNEFNIISLVLLSQLFLALDVYQYHYNAVLKSKINAKSSMLGKMIAMAMRAGFIYYEVDAVYFFIPFVVEGYIIYHIRRQCFDKVKRVTSVKIDRFRKHYISIGIPLVSTGACIAIYARMYEVILANVISYESVGLYSVAVALNFAWNFIPFSIGISLLSKPMRDNNATSQIQGYSFVTLVVILSTIPMLLTTYFLPELIIQITYGEQYIESAILLFTVALAVLLSTLGFISNRMINASTGGGNYLLKKVMFSSPILILLCYLLISQYGLFGAGLAFMLSELLNLTLFNYFFNNGMILKVHLSLFSSLSYYSNYKKIAH